MDRVQADNVHGLLRQHLEALELAMKLGQQLEQKLASSSAGVQGQPSVQTAAAQPLNYAFASNGREAEPEVSECQTGWISQMLSLWPDPRHSSQEPLLTAQAKLEDGESPGKSRRAGQDGENPGRDSDIAPVPSLAALDREMAHKMADMEHMVKQDAGWSMSERAGVREKDKFKSDGLARRIRLSCAFNVICFIAILGNVIWVYIDVNVDKIKHIHLISQVMGNALCAWYLIELVVWLLAFKRSRDAFTVWWFNLHAIIVGLMVWSIWVEGVIHARRTKDFSLLQVFRLFRVARAAGICTVRFNSWVYAMGILSGMKSIFPLLFLLSMIVYAFANAFKWLLSDDTTLGENFATVPQAFHYLFLCSLASVDKAAFKAMLKAGWVPWFLFVVFTLLGNLIVAKMLTGVLLQVVQTIIKQENEKAETVLLEQKIVEVAKELDSDKNGWLSRQEFQALMEHQDMLKSMAKHDMDVARFMNFMLVSLSANSELSVDDLLRSAKRFCGYKAASVKDIMTLRRLLYMEIDVIMNSQERIFENVQAIQRMPER